jgi:hypothetical protein
MAIFNRGMNVPRAQVDASHQAQHAVTLVFVVANRVTTDGLDAYSRPIRTMLGKCAVPDEQASQ